MEVHSAVGAFIITTESNPRALLVKHKKIGSWIQPGGHQESNENILEATIREVKEETGIDLSNYLPKLVEMDSTIKKLPLPNYLLSELIPEYGSSPSHIHQDSIYLVRIPYQKVTKAEKEHDDIGWFTKNDIENMKLLKSTKILLLEVFNSLDKTEE